MKFKYLFLSTLAAFALLSCAKENGSNDDPIKNSDVEGSESYISVRISMPGTTTKADDGYIDADANEVAVSEVAFMFFKGENQVSQPYFANASNWNNLTTGQSVDLEGNATGVMRNPTDDPDRLIVILNPGTLRSRLTVNLTMTQLKAIADNFKSTTWTESGKYIMSNSVYVADNEVQVGTEVTSSNFFEKETDAQGSPVDVYVERPIAKISLTDGLGDNPSTNDSTTTNAMIYANIEGWWLDNEPKSDLLLKPLSTSYSYIQTAKFGVTTTTGGDWNVASNFRSFWADPWTDGSTDFFQHNNWNTHTEWGTKTSYALENTNYSTNPTQVVVAAKLQVKDGDTYKDTSIVKYMGGNYIKDDFETERRNEFSNYYVAFRKEQTGGTGLYDTLYIKLSDERCKSVFSFVYTQNPGTSQKYKATVTFTEGTYPTVTDYEATNKYYVLNSATEKYEETTFNAISSGQSWEVMYYNQGRTYYYFPIVRDEDALTDDEPLNGVVRNHLYNITLTGIKGLGTAVPDDGSETIIPEKPDEKTRYLYADIKILAYRVVKQTVVLGE